MSFDGRFSAIPPSRNWLVQAARKFLSDVASIVCSQMPRGDACRFSGGGLGGGGASNSIFKDKWRRANSPPHQLLHSMPIPLAHVDNASAIGADAMRSDELAGSGAVHAHAADELA